MRVNKKLLALAVAALPAAVLPTAASAQEVKLYGLMDAFVGGYKTSGPGTGGASRTVGVVDSSGMTTSYWGISGSEDLGGGLKAIFAAESFMRNDTGQAGRFDGDTYFARSSYVGFSSNYGQATIGRNTNPYFLNTIIFNPFGDSFTFSPMVLNTFIGSGNAIVLGDTGFSNSLRYTSPSFGGLKFDVIGSAGAERDTAPKSTNRAFDAQAIYFGGPLSLGAVVRKIYLDAPATATTPIIGSNQLSWQLGAAYDFSVVKLFAQYQQQKLERDAAADQKAKTFQVGASVPIGAGSILASYVRTKYDNMIATSGEKRQTAAVGYDYFVSKRTDLYAMYSYDKTDAISTYIGAKQQKVGFGIRHRF